MNRIRINKGSFHLGQYNLENGATVTIGRSPVNDICLNDATASGQHAKIVTIMNMSYIQDLGSTNGTFVNDQKVKQRILKPNDIVSIGSHEIMFFSDQPQQAPATNGDNDKTQLAYPRPAIGKLNKTPFTSDN